MKAFVITGLDHLPSPETQWVRDAFTGCQTQHILFKDFGSVVTCPLGDPGGGVGVRGRGWSLSAAHVRTEVLGLVIFHPGDSPLPEPLPFLPPT